MTSNVHVYGFAAALVAAVLAAPGDSQAQGCVAFCNYGINGPRLPGESLRPAANAGECKARCDRNPACYGWQYWTKMYPGMCDLVGRGLRVAKTSLAISGIKSNARPAAAPPAANGPAPAAATPARISTFVRGRVWAGMANSDMIAGPTGVTAPACLQICIRNARCRAWNLWQSTPNASVTTGACNLFIKLPPRTEARVGGALGVIQLKAPESATPPPGTAGPPADPRQAYRAGLDANRRGDNKTAVEYLTAAIASGRLDPATRVSAIWVRGSSLFNLRRFAEARADYDVVVQAKPNEADPYRGRAMILRALGQLEAARADADKAVALAPKNAANHAERGHVRAAAGDNAGALEDYTQALALRPDDREALARRVQTYRRLGRFEEALADATRRVALAPNDPGALRERGALLRDLARYDEAAADFARVVQLKPDDSGVLWARALLELHRGNPAAAVADLGKYAQAHPGYAYGPILHFLAQQRAGQRGFATLARAALRLDLAKWPAPVIHFLLGNMTAPELLAAAKSEKPATEREQMCEAEFYLGQAALAGGDKAEARARLTRARELCARHTARSVRRLAANPPRRGAAFALMVRPVSASIAGSCFASLSHSSSYAARRSRPPPRTGARPRLTTAPC